MAFDLKELEALEGGDYGLRMGVFFRLSLDLGPLALWLGIGPIEPGVNQIDTTGLRYIGAGELLDVPAFNQLINGAAERVAFRLSGTSSVILDLASEENREAIKEKKVHVGLNIFDAEWQPLGPIEWLWRGTADYLSLSQEPPDSLEGSIIRTLELSVRSSMTGRRRPRLSFWNDADQQRRSPGDKFCDRAVRYSQETIKKWPSA
jgi:hypothetical protein